jgi:hypothetical protein
MLGIKKAFIQANLETKFPFDETAFAVYSACRMLDIEPVLYRFNRDILPELSRETLVYAGVPYTVAALTFLEIPVPEVLDYPSSLEGYLGRRILSSTLGALRQRGSSVPVFIKPRGGTKIFNGFTYTGSIDDQLRLNTFEDDTYIWMSEVVNFVSEYRILVHQGLIFACRHYKGDCTVFPDMDVARSAIHDFINAPVGYALDLGVTDMGKTMLVEVNDAWALGSYGTPPIPYTEMIINRWKQIVGLY